MNFQKILMPVLGVLLVAGAWRAYGWPGVALVASGIVMWLLLHFTRVASGIVMWLLLHFTRLTKVLGKAADRPIGHVASAVMLNARLKPGVNLLHVIAMTQALGERLSPEGEDPESYRWTDAGHSSVTCEFANGKLVKWTLFRPPQDEPCAPAA